MENGSDIMWMVKAVKWHFGLLRVRDSQPKEKYFERRSDNI